MKQDSKNNIVQKAHAYSLYSAHHSQNSIIEQLKEQFKENAISLRTLSRWISDFKKLPECEQLWMSPSDGINPIYMASLGTILLSYWNYVITTMKVKTKLQLQDRRYGGGE